MGGLTSTYAKDWGKSSSKPKRRKSAFEPRGFRVEADKLPVPAPAQKEPRGNLLDAYLEEKAIASESTFGRYFRGKSIGVATEYGLNR